MLWHNGNRTCLELKPRILLFTDALGVGCFANECAFYNYTETLSNELSAIR